MTLPRSVPIRATGILVTLVFLALEGVLHHLHCGLSDEVLMAAIGLVTVGVGGDTYRPSGQARTPAPSTSVTTVDITTPTS